MTNQSSRYNWVAPRSYGSEYHSSQASSGNPKQKVFDYGNGRTERPGTSKILYNQVSQVTQFGQKFNFRLYPCKYGFTETFKATQSGKAKATVGSGWKDFLKECRDEFISQSQTQVKS